MEKVMTTQSSTSQTLIGENELNAVSGGHQKFHYEEMNGHTYAIGHINGRTVAVRVD
jgi:predicted aspartyl protease